MLYWIFIAGIGSAERDHLVLVYGALNNVIREIQMGFYRKFLANKCLARQGEENIHPYFSIAGESKKELPFLLFRHV